MKIYSLQEVATIIAGQSPNSKYYNTDGNGIPFFQGKTDFGDLYPKVRVYCTNPIFCFQFVLLLDQRTFLQAKFALVED